VWQRQLLLDTTLQIRTFGEDQPGNLYVTDYATRARFLWLVEEGVTAPTSGGRA